VLAPNLVADVSLVRLLSGLVKGMASLAPKTRVIIALRDILEASNDVVRDRPDEITDVLKGRNQILCHRGDPLRDFICALKIVSHKRLSDLVQVETEARNLSDNLVDLVLHLALSNTHAINQHSIVYLLLPYTIIVTLEVVLLGLLAICGRFKSLDFIFPTLTLRLLFLQVSLKIVHLTFEIISELLCAPCLFFSLFDALLQLLYFLIEVKLTGILMLKLNQ